MNGMLSHRQECDCSSSLSGTCGIEIMAMLSSKVVLFSVTWSHHRTISCGIGSEAQLALGYTDFNHMYADLPSLVFFRFHCRPLLKHKGPCTFHACHFDTALPKSECKCKTF